MNPHAILAQLYDLDRLNGQAAGEIVEASGAAASNTIADVQAALERAASVLEQQSRILGQLLQRAADAQRREASRPEFSLN